MMDGVGARSEALAARNAVAAEMAMAARSGHAPADPCWMQGSGVVSDTAGAGARALAVPIQDALAGQGRHGLSVLVRNRHVPGVPETGWRARPRRRRELLELVFWFMVGGAGGLATLALVRLVDTALLGR